MNRRLYDELHISFEALIPALAVLLRQLIIMRLPHHHAVLCPAVAYS
jgi:hypothetical protein